MSDTNKTPIRSLLLATRNRHKAEELAAQLGDGWQVRSLLDVPDLPDVEETGTTFSANARLKAVEISKQVPGWVLADDSGIEVDALDGAPGVYSARYAGQHGDNAANNRKLLAELERLGVMNPTQRKARFHCVLVLSEGDRVLGEFPGVCEGYVALTPSTGPHGFGYDPLFVPEGYAETFGDLPAEVKARLSHRGKAVRRLHDFLATLG